MVAAILSYVVDEAFEDFVGQWLDPDHPISKSYSAYQQRHVIQPLMKLIEMMANRSF